MLTIWDKLTIIIIYFMSSYVHYFEKLFQIFNISQNNNSLNLKFMWLCKMNLLKVLISGTHVLVND